MAVAASTLAAAATLGLTIAAARHGSTHRLHAWPHWRALGALGSGAWAKTVQLAAVAPVLLVAPPCQLALHSAVCCWEQRGLPAVAYPPGQPSMLSVWSLLLSWSRDPNFLPLVYLLQR